MWMLKSAENQVITKINKRNDWKANVELYYEF